MPIPVHWSREQPPRKSLDARLVLSLWLSLCHGVGRIGELGLNPACKGDVGLTQVTMKGWEEQEPLSCS